MTDIALAQDIPAGASLPSDRSTGRWRRFQRRFHAWWEGIELAPEQNFVREAVPEAVTTPLEFPETPEELARIWAPRRIEAAELIWGDDFITPGGAEYAVTLAKPLGLT